MVSLHARSLVGLASGTVAGLAAFAFVRASGESLAVDVMVEVIAKPAGQIFIDLLFMLVLPLMFSTLVLSTSQLGDLVAFRRLGFRTLTYTLATTSIAVILGLVVVNLLQPGLAFDPGLRDALIAAAGNGSPAVPDVAVAGSKLGILADLVPRNVLRAAVNDQFLSVMLFAIAIGIALVVRPTAATAAFRHAIQGLNDAVMTLVGFITRFTPYAAACLMFALAAKFGWGSIMSLGRYIATVLLAMALHGLVVLPLWVAVVGKMSPYYFFRNSQEAIVTAFSTASTLGTLPTTLRVAEHRLHIPAHIARFVLTIGSSTNHHGTALFEGLTVLFLAQCFGVTLDAVQQISLLILSVVATLGTTGVPAGSIQTMILLLGYVHVPMEGIGLILGIDRLLDMFRTALNVTGDLATAVVVARKSPAEEAALFGLELRE